MCHLDIQKTFFLRKRTFKTINVLYTDSHESFPIHYSLQIENIYRDITQCYSVIKHYAVLLKSNRLFCLILRITVGNYFLMVSNEGEDHLWLYFVNFLNYPP